MNSLLDNKKEACKTYIDQTKQLITLASAFIVAPPGLIAVLKDRTEAGLTADTLCYMLAAEMCFVLSVIFGYIVMGSVTGSQDDGSYDVFRFATRFFSLAQFVSYLFGIGVSLILFYELLA